MVAHLLLLLLLLITLDASQHATASFNDDGSYQAAAAANLPFLALQRASELLNDDGTSADGAAAARAAIDRMARRGAIVHSKEGPRNPDDADPREVWLGAFVADREAC